MPPFTRSLMIMLCAGTMLACAPEAVAPVATHVVSSAPPRETAQPITPSAASTHALQPVSAEATAVPVTATTAPTALPVTPTEVAERVPVIEYHYSTYASGDQTIMRTEWFLAQLSWLAANGYHTLTGAEFAAYVRGETNVPARSVVLRFDVAQSHFDDYINVVVPALRANDQHGLFFILASRTSDDCDGLHACWSTLKQWADEGVISPESHTLWHIDYTELTPEEIRKDARESRDLIETKTGHTVHGLCYPFDSVAAPAIDILQDLGYDFAVAGNTRRDRGVMFADPDPYTLPSIYPYSSDAAYPQLTSHLGQTFETLLGSFH